MSSTDRVKSCPLNQKYWKNGRERPRGCCEYALKGMADVLCGLYHRLFRDSEVTFSDTFVPSDIFVLNIRCQSGLSDAFRVFRLGAILVRLAMIPSEIGRIIAVQSFLGRISTELERKDRCPISGQGHILSDQRLHSSNSLNKGGIG